MGGKAIDTGVFRGCSFDLSFLSCIYYILLLIVGLGQWVFIFLNGSFLNLQL